MRFTAAMVGLAWALVAPAAGRDAETEARVREGILLARQGHWTAAREQLLAVLREEPGNAEAVRELAAIARGMGDMTNCIRYWERLVALTPGEAGPRFELGNLYFFFRQEVALVHGCLAADAVTMAQEQYRQARRLSPDEYRYAAALAESFGAVEPPRWEEAEEAWRYCLALAPDRTAVYCRLARVCIDAGALDRAEAYLANARGLQAAELRAEVERRRRLPSSASLGKRSGRDS